MKLHHIGQICGIVFVVNLFVISPSMALPISWNKLGKIEQRVLKAHHSKWNHYSEQKQKRVLHKHRPDIEGVKWFKGWVKRLPKKEQKELVSMLKRYGRDSIEFKGYVDLLIKRHR